MMTNAKNRFPGRGSKPRDAFTPISLLEYVRLQLRANPNTKEVELIARLREALQARRKGILCRCGEPIWVVGSAAVGLRCFTCITGEAEPDRDCELEYEADETAG